VRNCEKRKVNDAFNLGSIKIFAATVMFGAAQWTAVPLLAECNFNNCDYNCAWDCEINIQCGQIEQTCYGFDAECVSEQGCVCDNFCS